METTINKSDLKRGLKITFTNADEENPRDAVIDMNDKEQFRIWFNGEFIWIGKTFSSMITRFKKLSDKWDLTFTNIEE